MLLSPAPLEYFLSYGVRSRGERFNSRKDLETLPHVRILMYFLGSKAASSLMEHQDVITFGIVVRSICNPLCPYQTWLTPVLIIMMTFSTDRDISTGWNMHSTFDLSYHRSSGRINKQSLVTSSKPRQNCAVSRGHDGNVNRAERHIKSDHAPPRQITKTGKA